MRTDAEFLNDILNAIGSIPSFLDKKNLADFGADRTLQYATLYEITVIGEASNRLTRALRARHPEVPWHGVRGMRNRVVHEYFSVDPELLWKTIQSELDPLESHIRAILEQEFPGTTPAQP